VPPPLKSRLGKIGDRQYELRFLDSKMLLFLVWFVHPLDTALSIAVFFVYQ
jgi:hypothetical protein